MVIERTNNEIIIRLPLGIDTEEIQDFVDYLRYKELTSRYRTAQSEVDKITSEINASWWEKNKSKYIN